MKIVLTKRQAEQLVPYFDRVRATAALGTPGMLVAQLSFDPYRMEYFMTPAFLDHDKAQLVTECGRAEIPGNTNEVAP
jgi:hypothetical protein